MTNKTIDDIFKDIGDIYDNVIVFKNPDYVDAFIGITTDNRACYDYYKMIKCLEDDGMTYDEAVEWLDYNVIGSPIQDGPIIIYID